MKSEIIGNLSNPQQLEKLYRENKSEFKKQFNEIYPNYRDKIGLQVWNERLNFESEKVTLGSKKETVGVIVLIIFG